MRTGGASFAGGVFAACLCLLAAGPAFAACNADKAIFEDDFEFLDVSWTEPGIVVEDGALIIEGTMGRVNLQTVSKAADVCADLTTLEAANPDYSAVGLVFWWQDWSNYYSVWAWNNGWVQARRMLNGNELILFAEETPALKKGVGETHSIQLKLRPRDATLFVNGTEIKRFKGKPPPNGGAVGFYGLSPADAPAKFAFDNLVVSEPDD